MSLVRIEGVHKRFGKLEVLHDINLTVEEGKQVTLIGRSGSGKSTLLRCINGLEHIQEGNITLHVQMGKQVKTLKDDPDFLTQPFQVGFFSVHMIAVDPNITLLYVLETVDASQEGTFTRTAAADEGHLLAFLNG